MTYLFKLSRRAASGYLPLVASLLLIACSEAAPRDFLSPDPGTPSSSTAPIALVIKGAAAILPYDQIYTFSAWGRRTSGDSIPTAVSWVASAGQITADGNYRGTVPGTHTITAYAVGTPSLTASTTITVSAPGPLFAHLDVHPKPVLIGSGGQVNFGVTARLQSGANTLPAVTWSATGGGSVTPGGVFAAGSVPGTYAVIATTLDGLLSDTALVTVEEASLTLLRLDPRVVTIPGGAIQDFIVRTEWADGSAAAAELEWETEAGSLITSPVAGGPMGSPGNGQSGRLKADAEPGNYKLVVKERRSGKSDTALVTVTPVLEAVIVSPGAVELLPGVTAAFSAKGRMSDDNLTNISVVWSATGGTISSSGVYTAGSVPGTYRVTGRVAGGTLADTSSVTVSQPVATLTSLTLTPGTGTVPVGGVVQFGVSATWTNGSTALPALTWSSQAGTVSPEGLWTAPAAAGSYAIIARQTGGSLADTALFNVVVPAPTVSVLTVSPDSPGVQGGQEINFEASATWTDGSSVLPPITWSASGGTVNADGRWVAPNLSGVFRVVARTTVANVADTAVVTVAESPVVTSVRVTPSIGAVSPSGLLDLDSEITWSDGQLREVTKVWTATGGTVSPSGKFTAGLVAGQFLVVASCGGCTVSDTAYITVTEPVVAAPVVTQLVLNPATLDLAAGASQTFQVAAAWSDGSTTVPPLAWTVGGGSMSGMTYTAGSSGGTYKVIARHAGSTVADTSVVFIGGAASPPPSSAILQSLAVSPASASVPAGGILQFSASGTWSDGGTAVPPVTWTATGGTITSNGAYTAGSNTGTFQVTANHVPTGLSAQRSVTVTSAQAWASVEPELPRASVDVTYPTITGATINVAAGGNLQSAINGAACGDQIVLAAGAVFTGNFVLPNKGCTTYIVIRGGGPTPAPGTRVSPATAAGFPKLMAPNSSSSPVEVGTGAGYYRLVGLEVSAPSSVTSLNALVRLNATPLSNVAQLPHHIVLDRMYIHGHANLGLNRCVMMNSASTAVINSYLDDCHAKGSDSQAIVGWTGTGPYLIENNFLAGAGENIMFGGADPAISGLVPSDITIRRNHVFKDLGWKGVWTVKNLLELKNAQRVLVEDNVFENNWADAQVGFAHLFKSTNQGGSAPWSAVTDVTFRYNLTTNSFSGLNLAANPQGQVVPTARIKLEHNIFEKIGASSGGNAGVLFQLLGNSQGLSDIQIRHTTATNAVNVNTMVSLDGAMSQRMTMVDNFMPIGTYGVKGTSTPSGEASLTRFQSPFRFAGNALVGASNLASTYPSGTLFVSGTSVTSALLGAATDGTNVGADASLVMGRLSGVRSF